MEGYFEMTKLRLLEDEQKSSGSTKKHQESYIQLRDYYSSQAYFDDLDLVQLLDFPADLPCGVLSKRCCLWDLLDEHFRWGVELEIATKKIKER